MAAGKGLALRFGTSERGPTGRGASSIGSIRGDDSRAASARTKQSSTSLRLLGGKSKPGKAGLPCDGSEPARWSTEQKIHRHRYPDRKMHVAGAWPRDPQPAVDGILCGIDADHEDSVLALAGSRSVFRPNRFRAGHAFRRKDTPEFSTLAKRNDLRGMMAAGIDASRLNPEFLPILAVVAAQKKAVEVGPNLLLRRIAVQNLIVGYPAFLLLAPRESLRADRLERRRRPSSESPVAAGIRRCNSRRDVKGYCSRSAPQGLPTSRPKRC